MERFTAVVFVLMLTCICSTIAQSCETLCGQNSSSCSCHTTCTSLGSCCADYSNFCVDTLPYSGSMMGGTDFIIQGVSFNQSERIRCRFSDKISTSGYVDESGRGHCISPLLYMTGWVTLQVTSDSGIREGSWLSVHTGKLDAKFKGVLVNSTQWQYYGTPNYGGVLEMTWNTSLVRAERVNIELWGYRETGEPYSDQWRAEWVYLYSLARNQSNSGTFSFLPKPAEPEFSGWELGALRVSSSLYPDGVNNVNSVWTEDHALAWHLEQKFRDDSEAWALDKCVTWDRLETKLPNFLNEIIDCPCTLAQARADTGRFHTDYGCDIEKGSVCTYHPGCVHCVRAIEASPLYGAGQQCCYDSTGAQVLTGDSLGGSTPDRAHDWGSPPYNNPPRIPGQSHWLYDVLSFYYCCLWSDNCHYYFKHRPSSDCRRYQTPSSAVVFGDPHFITFDGVSYSFNGKGEYTLVLSETKNLTIQGRTEPVNETIKATKLSSVAMQERSSDIVEVRLASGVDGLQVLQNQRTLSFSEQSWMDLHGVFVFSPTPSNITVMFPSGAGVEVRRRGETMTTTVLLPETFKGLTKGLLGNMNENPDDDLILSNGLAVRNQSNPEEVFSFGASWAVFNKSALFTYDSKYLQEEYLYGPRHDLHFIPVFTAPESPDDPLGGQASQICTGEGSQFCRYDILVGRSPVMGNSTKASYQSHVSLVKDLKQVVACGYLPAPANGNKTGNQYLQGSKVQITCNDGYNLKGSTERVCQEDGRWSGEDTTCETPVDHTAGIIAGSVIGAIALIVIITTIVLVSKKQKRKQAEKEMKVQSF